MQVVFLVVLTVVGMCLGSFLCCQARRLHLRSKKSRKKMNTRSVCLHCDYQLKWYDNVPVVSWLVLGGKCRKCGKKIGVAEIVTEISTGLALLMLGTTIDVLTASVWEWVILVGLILLTLVLIFLAIYDGLYGELPTIYLVMAIIMAAVVLVLRQAKTITLNGFNVELIIQPLAAVLLLGGLYLMLYLVSRGKWVGDGDWMLATAIGLALGNLWLALITLCLANFAACIYALPRLKASKQIYLGPFLVMAFVITITWANFFQTLV